MPLKGKKLVLIFLSVFLLINFSYADFYQNNSRLTLEENRRISDELNSDDLLRADGELVLEKYQRLSEMLNDEIGSIDFKIQVIRNKLLLAQLLDDNREMLKILEEYFQKYSEFDKSNSYYLHESLCTLKQMESEDKTQSTCFKETKKLYDEILPLKIFSEPDYYQSYKYYFMRYQMALINYFASAREKTDELCSIIKDYKNSSNKANLPDDETFLSVIKDSLNTYVLMQFLTGEDVGSLGCFSDFRTALTVNGHVVDVSLTQELAEKGDSEAQYRLGVLYKDGDRVEKDLLKAISYLELAAQQGHARAQLDLGLMYRSGQDVNRDYDKAIQYLEMADKQGYARAQINLGFMYEEGAGVKRNLSVAKDYYRKACEGGLPTACEIYENLDIETLD